MPEKAELIERANLPVFRGKYTEAFWEAWHRWEADRERVVGELTPPAIGYT